MFDVGYFPALYRLTLDQTLMNTRVRPAHAPRRIPYLGEHRQAAERAAADIEGHSEAAKFGQSG
jgi:hypothetical protein